MSSTRHLRAVVALILASASLPVAAVPDMPVPETAPVAAGPEGMMKARLAYNVGYEDYEKAQRLEMEAGSLPPAKARDYAGRIAAGYSAARDRFAEATEADPSQKQGWNMLGFTRRKLGDFGGALAAYDKALALDPDYPEATEYRAEALLALGRLEEVKAAHQRLRSLDAAYAATLRDAAGRWLADRRKSPGGVPAADLDALEAWLAAAR
ncbi:MAG: hypothetical protein RL026_2517 [Pseudomonadota bacterium]